MRSGRFTEVHAHKVSPGHAERTRIRLEQNVFPWLGRLALASVTAPKLLECLRWVEKRGTVETAHRVKQACGQVFRYGIATGHCERDPSGDLRNALRPVVVAHHAALTEPRRVGVAELVSVSLSVRGRLARTAGISRGRRGEAAARVSLRATHA